MYARGILFGKMKYELGDHSFVRCPETGLTADIDFKTKGWVSGTYNAIGGTIKDEATGEVLYELSGLWSEEMFIKNMRVGSAGNLCIITKLTWPIDRTQGDVLQRAEVETQLPDLPAFGGTGGKGIAKAMGQDGPGSQGPQP